jgi:hypothetical protein
MSGTVSRLREIDLEKRVRDVPSPRYVCWCLFGGANHSIRTVEVLSAQARTVRGQEPDSPRPGTGAGIPCLTAGRSAPCGRMVRACALGGEGRRRRLDLAPGRDPVGEERSQVMSRLV